MKFFKDWQGAIGAVIVLVAFCLMPAAFTLLSVTSGTIDWAYLQALAFTTIVFFVSILCAWIAIQCDWKMLTRHIGSGKLQQDWLAITPFQRILILKGTIFALILFYILCYACLPKP